MMADIRTGPEPIRIQNGTYWTVSISAAMGLMPRRQQQAEYEEVPLQGTSLPLQSHSNQDHRAPPSIPRTVVVRSSLVHAGGRLVAAVVIGGLAR